jgi:hypothetical protein
MKPDVLSYKIAEFAFNLVNQGKGEVSGWHGFSGKTEWLDKVKPLIEWIEAYYEPLIQQAQNPISVTDEVLEETVSRLEQELSFNKTQAAHARQIVSDLWDACETVVQQARQEVAREIEEQLLSPELLEIGRKAIEDTLIEWRDNRLSEFTRGNGLVIRERNGKDSSMIRFGPETALRIGINAMWKSLISKYLQEKS